MNKLNTILLIDDDSSSNFLNNVIIDEAEVCEQIITKTGGEDALDYIQKEENAQPDLIFLDINMPRMNGWEFLEEFVKIRKDEVPVCMLTTSINPREKELIHNFNCVIGFETKPLSEEILNRVIAKLS